MITPLFVLTDYEVDLGVNTVEGLSSLGFYCCKANYIMARAGYHEICFCYFNFPIVRIGCIWFYKLFSYGHFAVAMASLGLATILFSVSSTWTLGVAKTY